MGKSNLKAKWYDPDNSVPSPNQLSIRLPILATARISAICEMFPTKTKNQIVKDLILQALEDFIESLASEKGSEIDVDEDGATYKEIGERVYFSRLTEKHLRPLEKEAKVENPIPFPKEHTIWEPHK